MKPLVIYDSKYGNTKIIAEQIAKGAKGLVMRAADVKQMEWDLVKLLIVGSPTQGGRPTQAVVDIFSYIHDKALKGIKVAAFDTRYDEKKANMFLKLLMKTIKYAAEKIHNLLISKGGESIAPPMGFIVEEKSGPLRVGEKERALKWGMQLAKKHKK